MAFLGDDCYFFLTSHCVRDTQCAFRHQPAAKNTEAVCPEWIKGSCFNQSCGLRHLQSNTGSRSAIQCHWELKPSGCLDASCMYMHLNKKKIPDIKVTTSVSVSSLKPAVISSNSQAKPFQLPTITPTTGPIQTMPVLPIFEPTLPTIEPALPTIEPSLPIIEPTLPIIEPLLPTIEPASQVAINNATLKAANPSPQIILQPPMMRQQAPPQHMIKVAPHFMPQAIPMPRHSHISILGPPPQALTAQSFYTKSSDLFHKQVQMFKDLLASKSKASEDEGYDSKERREKYKERHNRHKREKKYNRKMKEAKMKTKLSKVDEEILYGDYKDVPLDKRENNSEDSDSQIHVKSYEEILREKALRKMMQNKQKFDKDFKKLTTSKTEQNKSKGSTETTEGKTSPTNVVFSGEDAIELGLDVSPIHEQPEDEPLTPNNNSENQVENAIESEILETDDINFSVDEDDDLAKELNEVAQNKNDKSRTRKKKFRSSVVNAIHSPSERKSRNKKAILIQDNSPLRTREIKKPRKVITLDTQKPVEAVPKKKVKTNVITVEDKEPPAENVRVKSFEEIMAEKKKRKAAVQQTNEQSTAVLDEKPSDPLLERSVQAKNELRANTAIKRPIVNRSRILLAKNKETDDKLNKRKSLEIYKPKVLKENEKADASKPTEVPTKLIKISKQPSEVATAQEEKPIGIRSFKEIMEKKRVRRLQQQKQQTTTPAEQTTNVLQQRRNRFIKRPILSAEIKTVVPLVKNTEPIVAKVEPMKENTQKEDALPASDLPKDSLTSSDAASEHDTQLLDTPITSEQDPSATSDVSAKPTIVVPPMAKEFIENGTDGVTSEANDATDNDATNPAVEEEAQDSPSSREDIQAALDEEQRKRDEYLLSDDEFEKEINDLSDDDTADVDDDDLMMELEEMLSAN